MRLSAIIKDTAARMKDVTVKVDTDMGTVCISDDNGIHEDIFMQGDDADKFIEECRHAYNKCRNLTMDECYAWQAELFVDCLWN